MTTTARPTFEPARGGQGRGEKDLSAISKQCIAAEIYQLKVREREREREKDKSSNRRMLDPPRETSALIIAKKQKIDQVPTASLDADDPLDDDDSQSESDEDDTAALLAELQQRKEQNKKKKRQEEERTRMENILSRNPLLSSSQGGRTDMKDRRRWDDDVVFKNCARSEPKKKHDVFINDSFRSEFH
ncbi:LOW QUALITY PROTEIN: hypothetical protein E2986_14036 [Frieseomelitta varia]|uniref:Uncharacterized protein n=1 Tax=Frieseomelitta varia TaxID=561572 RepID=A0A833SD94_9HYME|nr:LOW QUALITY PROTEIN: hypothetical protein E2986_14036 [Frieseomelitta varia]